MTVAIAASGDSDIAVKDTDYAAPGDQTGPITFTPANWNRSRHITISAAQDDDLINGSATISHTAAGGGYEGLSATLTANESDDDTPSIVVSSARVSVPEGGSASYAVKLSNKPSGNVSVSLAIPTSGTNDQDLDFAPANLTFTPTNWNAARTITLTAAQDDDDTATFTHTVTSSDGYYGERTIGDIAVTADDNDASIVLSHSSVTVRENGSATYSVSLTNQPTANVVVAITEGTGNDDDANLYVLASQLTLTPNDWNAPKTVRIYASGDSDAINGTRAINHAASGAAEFAGATASLTAIERDSRAAIQFRNADDDANISAVAVREGSSAAYKVKLAAQPAGNVTVALSISGSDPDGDISFAPSSLTFTAQNYSSAQTVTVSAAEDTDVANGSAAIAHAATGGGYDGVSRNLTATETDNTGQIQIIDYDDESISPISINVPEGGSAKYKVKLSHQPIGNVTVRLSRHSTTRKDDPDLTTSPSTLYFNSGNWNVGKTVTVSAKEDNDAVNGERAIIHTATGVGYEGSKNNINAFEDDNDGGLIFTHGTSGQVISARLPSQRGEPRRIGSA